MRLQMRLCNSIIWKFAAEKIFLTMTVIVMTTLNDKFCIQENEFEPRQLLCSSLNFLSLIAFPASSAFSSCAGDVNEKADSFL